MYTGLWAVSALLCPGTDPLQPMCPCCVRVGVSRRHRNVQVYVSQTPFGVNESLHREQGLPGTLQGAAADQD